MRNALPVGAAVHAIAGVVFAFAYVNMLDLVLVRPNFLAVPLGGVMGLVHGIVVAYVIMAGVSERHPVEKFQSAGVPVAVAHIVGHIAYGLGVGGMMWFFQIQWHVIP